MTQRGPYAALSCHGSHYFPASGETAATNHGRCILPSSFWVRNETAAFRTGTPLSLDRYALLTGRGETAPDRRDETVEFRAERVVVHQVGPGRARPHDLGPVRLPALGEVDLLERLDGAALDL